MRQRSKKSRIITVMAAIAALIGGYYLGNQNKNLIKPKPQIATLIEQGRALNPFSLQTQHDASFNNEDLLGKWSFLYFGYTFCPDICPTTLVQFVQMSNRLSAHDDLLEKTRFIMVSVDPDRDTPERLDAYMTHFHPDFIGATGTREAIDSLTDDLGIYYKLQEPDENGNYPVDHTSAVMLINPDGKLMAVFGAVHDPKTAAEDFLIISEQYDE